MRKITSIGVIIGISTIMYFFLIGEQKHKTLPQYHFVTQMDIQHASQVAWSPDNSALAIVKWPDVQIWDTNTWDIRVTFTDIFTSDVAWHPFESQLAAVRGGVGEGILEESILLMNIETGEVTDILTYSTPNIHLFGPFVLGGISWHPDGTQIITPSVVDTLYLWDLTSSEYPKTLVPANQVSNIIETDYSPNGEMILTGAGRSVRVWDAQTGVELLSINDSWPISWSPDGDFFASSSYDHAVNIRDAQTGELKAILDGLETIVRSINWSPSGKFIVGVDLEHNLCIWIETANNCQQIPNLPTDSINELAWNTDESFIAVVEDHRVSIWERL